MGEAATAEDVFCPLARCALKPEVSLRNSERTSLRNFSFSAPFFLSGIFIHFSFCFQPLPDPLLPPVRMSLSPVIPRKSKTSEMTSTALAVLTRPSPGILRTTPTTTEVSSSTRGTPLMPMPPLPRPRRRTTWPWMSEVSSFQLYFCRNFSDSSFFFSHSEAIFPVFRPKQPAKKCFTLG